MKRRAVSQMLGALILIAIVLVGAVLVYNYVWGASGRIAGAPGVSISGASLAALPGGGGYLRVSITNTGGVIGFASVALYSSSGQVFNTSGLLYQIYYIPTQWYQPDPNAVYSAGM
ncbi:MAG: archaellin/type IV pilin N-terminal domain-containing protein, partial [Conexivisphaera sp.]